MHRRARQRLLALVVCIAAATGCGTNALRVEYAGEVGTKGRAAAAASREYLKQVETARQEANLDLVEADPACGRWRPALRIPPLVGPDRPASGWLCVSAAGAPEGAVAITLRPIASELLPTLQLADALTAYADALIEAAQGERVSPAQGFIDALATVRSVQNFVVAATGSEPGPIPGANDPRIRALTGFVNFLGELAVEAGRVDGLRQIMLRHPDGAQPLIAALREHLDTWELSRKSDRAIENVIETALLSATFAADPPVAGAQRRAALQNYYRREAERLAANQLHPRLDALLLTLKQADEDLRRVLQPDPNLTPAEQARVAELNRKRIVRALDGLTDIITAFRRA